MYIANLRAYDAFYNQLLFGVNFFFDKFSIPPLSILQNKFKHFEFKYIIKNNCFNKFFDNEYCSYEDISSMIFVTVCYDLLLLN